MSMFFDLLVSGSDPGYQNALFVLEGFFKIFLIFALLGLRCCVQALSSYCELALGCCVFGAQKQKWFLIAVASLVAEPGLLHTGLSSCSSWAQ